MNKIFRRSVGLLFPLLAGCAQLGPNPDFSSWVVGYNKSVEQAQNQSMLLNVLRAGDNMPLYFMGTQVVRGTGSSSVSGSIGGSQSLTWNQQNFGNTKNATLGLTPNLSISVGRDFNFDVAVADTAEFQTAILTPMKEDVMHFYTQQGLPAELLYHLLVQKIRVTENGHQKTYENNPLSESYGEFIDILSKMLGLGLTTQAMTDPMPVGPVYRNPDLRGLAAVAQAGAIMIPSVGGYQAALMRPIASFCFDPSVKGNVERLPASVLCSTPDQGARQGAPGLRRVQFENSSVYVQLRSTKEIFNYLGELVLRAQMDPNEKPLQLVTPASLAYLRNGPCSQEKDKYCHSLFRLHNNVSSADGSVAVEYNGKNYGIRANDGTFSALVLSVLVQTMNLNKSVNSIPLTTTTIVR